MLRVGNFQIFSAKMFKFTQSQWKKFGNFEIHNGKIWKFPDLQHKNWEISNPVNINFMNFKIYGVKCWKGTNPVWKICKFLALQCKNLEISILENFGKCLI